MHRHISHSLNSTDLYRSLKSSSEIFFWWGGGCVVIWVYSSSEEFGFNARIMENLLLLQSPVADSMKGSEQKPASSAFSPSLLPEEENEGFEPTVKR